MKGLEGRLIYHRRRLTDADGEAALGKGGKGGKGRSGRRRSTGKQLRRGAGLLLRRLGKNGERWLLLRDRKRGKWGFPKGHLESGESIVKTARRECREEIGHDEITLSGDYVIVEYENYDDIPKQVVYFLATTDRQPVVLSREHSAYRWCTAAEALDLLDRKGVRKAFRKVVDQLERRRRESDDGSAGRG